VTSNRREAVPAGDDAQFLEILKNWNQGIAIRQGEKIVFANQAFADMCGFESPQEILSLDSALLLIAEHERERVTRYFTARVIGGDAPVCYEIEFLRKGGSRWWAENRAQIVSWNGAPAVMMGIYDISERKRTEAALRESEARFRDFAEVASDWYWETDTEHRFKDYAIYESESASNPDWSHTLGKTRLEMRPDDDTDDEKWQRHRADLEARRPFRNFMYRLRDGHRGYRHVKISGRPVYDAAGSFIGYRGTGSDITMLRQRDEELKRSEQRFRNLVQGSIQGVVVHRGGEVVFANQAMADIFGYDHPDEIMCTETLESLVLGSDMERMRGYSRDRLLGKPAPSQYEFRAKRRDGTPIWLETRPALVDWEGLPATQFVMFDITDRKVAEAEVRRSNARFRDLLEESNQGIGIRQDDKVVFANQALADLFGYDKPEEMLALESVEALQAPQESERIRAYKELREKGLEAPPQYEYRGRHKDGSIMWLENRVQKVIWNGRPAILGMTTDIGARKRAEDALNRAYDQMEVKVEERTQELRREVDERKQAEQALRESEERFRQFFEKSPTAMRVVDFSSAKTYLADLTVDSDDLLAWLHGHPEVLEEYAEGHGAIRSHPP